jgi:hypothetical protein
MIFMRRHLAWPNNAGESLQLEANMKSTTCCSHQIPAVLCGIYGWSRVGQYEWVSLTPQVHPRFLQATKAPERRCELTLEQRRVRCPRQAPASPIAPGSIGTDHAIIAAAKMTPTGTDTGICRSNTDCWGWFGL